MQNAWDHVAGQFNTYKEMKWWGAADNVATVWPIFLNYIESNFSNPKNLRALDFGCGTGGFCNELQNLGFNVTGIDISEEMIKIAKENLPQDIKLHMGDTTKAKELAQSEGQFNLITAIMVLQFIETDKIAELVSCLKSGGHLIFVNHNPAQLEARGIKDTFALGDGSVSVRVYKRTAEEYDKIFSDLGFKKTFEKLQNSDPKIIEKYKISYPFKAEKYLMLAYQKA